MKVTKTKLDGVLIIEPTVFRDSRGSFKETWHGERYAALGIPTRFVQDNVSVSSRGVVRGLHYQLPRPQGKLVSVLSGKIFDVAVDIRLGSPSYGEWISAELTEENNRQLYVPEGFAHGFMSLADDTKVLYKCTEYYDATAGWAIRFDDPKIGIEWPSFDIILSDSDRDAPVLENILRKGLFYYEL